MTSPSKRYHPITLDEKHKLNLLRAKLFRAYKGGLFTLSELTDKLLTIGGFTFPLHATKFIMDMEGKMAEESNTLSYRERKRRSLLASYNKGLLTEQQLEGEISKYFVNDGTHPRNQTTIKTTKDLHLYLAARSVRYSAYLLATFPVTYSGLIEQPKQVKHKLDLDARQLRVATLLEQMRKENNNE